jgi:hypothetical protein
MLPFLKHNYEGSASAPVESVERKPDEESEDYDALESAAEDLCHAIEAKDYKAAAAALRAAFELCDTEPHKEGPHIG